MPVDYNNPAIIRFLKESYDKENEQRISWFVKNKEEIVKAASLSDKHKDYRTDDVAKAFVEPCIPSLTVHHQVSVINRRIKVPRDNPIPERTLSVRKGKDSENIKTEEEIAFGTFMKPVEPEVSKIIFEEIPNGGRRQYLRVRNKKAPEERYYDCETSNNVLGWRLGDSQLGYHPSVYRRYASLKRDTLSRSGPQPDPKHYNKPQEFSKCTL